MRMSRLFPRTRRENPAEAESRGHAYLVRAGFVRPVAAGIFTYLSMGKRVLTLIEGIVREEMERAGAQEILMPALLPGDPWKVTGRWEAYGEVLMRLKDRAGRDFCLGPTHEEVVTPLAAGEYASYKDLPVNLFQIQTKFRDEPRARGGLLRAREFIMKDAYSFDADHEGLRTSYAAMAEAYPRIFSRCGVQTVGVEALAGEIGGEVNQEFMVPSEVGEDLFVTCSNCDYAANVEAASFAVQASTKAEEPRDLEAVHTPQAYTAAEVANLLGVPIERVLKCIMYRQGPTTIAALVPGEREVNEGKLKRIAGPTVTAFRDEDFRSSGLVKGYVGPVGLEAVRIIADRSLKGQSNLVAGGNETDFHLTCVNVGRDFDVDAWEDIGTVVSSDRCPRCESPLAFRKGIEVGHVFQLGTKYSVPLEAHFTDANGVKHPLVMGCYGMGVSRLMGAAAEQLSDEHGLVWPALISPYRVHLIPTRHGGDEENLAEHAYGELSSRGITALIDDRRQISAGAKFADADLIGITTQVIAGRKASEGLVELKDRKTGDRSEVSLDDAISSIEPTGSAVTEPRA